MIRLRRKKDLKQIEAFDEFGGDREQEVLEQRLEVCLIENRVVGYISVISYSCLCGHPIISFLCIQPEYRRQGIASQLLTKVESHYSGQKLFISTESNNRKKELHTSRFSGWY